MGERLQFFVDFPVCGTEGKKWGGGEERVIYFPSLVYFAVDLHDHNVTGLGHISIVQHQKPMIGEGGESCAGSQFWLSAKEKEHSSRVWLRLSLFLKTAVTS